MKKHIRLIALILFLLSFSVFCACSSGAITKKTDVCIKINNEPLDNSYIGYFFYIAKTSMLSEAGYTVDNSSEEDIKTYWETAEIDGVNAVEVARDIAADNAVFQKIQYQKAVEEGITLSDEQISAIKAEIADIISENGGKDKFEKILNDRDTSMDAYEQILTENLYISELYNLYDSNGTLNVTNDELYAFSDAHFQQIAPENMLDSAKMDKFNSIAKQWEKNADIFIDDEAMKQFEV